jgi:ferric-dicitrate binding protein FerR (iron transport regulator)
VKPQKDFDPADERWLFAGGAAPDARSERIERLLALQRAAPRSTAPRSTAARPSAARTVRAVWLGAAALALAAIGVLWTALGTERGGYRVFSDGQARIVRPGETIETEVEDARLEVGSLGDVRLDGGSRLVVREASRGLHRFFLERGALTASITAEPGAFGVDTPAGSSLDLGCLYHLAVDEQGTTRLEVLVGRVSFEHAASGRYVYVPAGSSCEARVERGPASPVWERADPSWRANVERLDFESAPEENLLALVGSSDDTLALWHLLGAAAASTRAAAWDRLSALVPPPDQARRELFEGPFTESAQAARKLWLRRMDWFTYDA